MASELDQRKKQILKVITDDYIQSAEPVGSRTIARKHNLGLSPATIRNEMADLEEGGYLEQPHTSAGRVPSERGYRYYVDALMSLYKLNKHDVDLIYKELEQHQLGIEAVIQQTSKILVQITKYPSMVLSPQIDTAVLKHLQLIRLSETTILMILVTDTGLIENKMIELQTDLSDSELERVSNLLNQRLKGINLRDIQMSLFKEINSEILIHQEFFDEAVKILLKSIILKSGDRVITDGATRILEQPEFMDIQKFKPILKLMEEEERLYHILTQSEQAGALVKIGHENRDLDIHDCSVVTASYQIAGRTVGVIGVLGPTRMEYAKVLPLVEYTAAALSELLTNLSKRGLR